MSERKGEKHRESERKGEKDRESERKGEREREREMQEFLQIRKEKRKEE